MPAAGRSKTHMNRPRRLPRAAPPILVALLLATALATASSLGKMPEWKAVLPNGAAIASSQYQGKVVVLHFWASFSAPSRQQMGDLVSLQSEHQDAGLQVIGVSFDREPDEHARWLSEQAVNFPSIYGRSGTGLQMARTIQQVVGPINGVPMTLIVDRGGNILHRHDGLIEDNLLEAQILPLLKK